MDVAVLRNQHDELLSNAPEGANHDAADCPFCNGSISGDEQASEGGVMATYTDEEAQALVAEAVSPLQARIAELEASHEQAELDAKIAEATAALKEQVAELQSKLDTAVLEAETAKQEYTSLVEFLETAKAEEEAAQELAARREERLAVVREAASFPEEHLAANADRWAAMDDAAFQAAVEDWKLISAKGTPAPAASGVPAETAMAATAGAGKTTPEGKALMRDVFDMTIRGIDPRKV